MDDVEEQNNTVEAARIGADRFGISLDQMRDILDGISDPFYVVDRDWRFTFVNRRVEQLWGKRRADLLGRSLWDVFPEAVGSASYRAHLKAAQEGRAVEIETVSPVLGVWVGISIYPGDNCLAVFFRDVHARKQAEQALRTSEEQYRQLLDTAREGLVRVDPQDIITYANVSLCEMIGCATPEELVGRSLYEFYYDEDTAHARERRGQRRQGLSEQYEMRLRRFDGSELWTLASVSVMQEEGRYAGTFTMLTDITKRRQVEEEASAAYEKEHRIAESLQRSLLSKPPPEALLGMEVATAYRPAWDEAQVGGDFYDILALDGGKIALVVGDVSGKGLAAATRTAEIKFTLRAYLREYPYAAPALNRLNGFLCEAQALEHGRPDFFVVLSLAVLDSVTGTIDFSVAGAEPPLILRTGGEVDEIALRCLPLGVIPKAEYESVTHTLTQGDLVLMSTDGLTEARRGNAFLGIEGLTQLARQALTLETLEEIGQKIVTGAQAFAGSALHDDVCLLLARLR